MARLSVFVCTRKMAIVKYGFRRIKIKIQTTCNLEDGPQQIFARQFVSTAVQSNFQAAHLDLPTLQDELTGEIFAASAFHATGIQKDKRAKSITKKLVVGRGSRSKGEGRIRWFV